MPVEINQLHIKVHVDQDNEKKDRGDSTSMSQKEKKQLIAAAVTATLDVLERQKQR